MMRGLNPGRFKSVFFSANRPALLWGPSSLLFNGYQGSLPGAKRLGREVSHLPPSNVEVKNEWSYTCSPPIRLHGVDKDNCT